MTADAARRGFSVRVFLPDGDPAGLKVIEKSNWTGEGDPVLPRLEEHGRKKEFWTHAVVFTSKDQSLNKAHVQRLEAQLVELAAGAKRCVLDNGNTPQAPSLAEADTADVDGFLDDVRLCLPTLGYGFFDAASARASVAEAVSLFLRTRGADAEGAETPDGFVVRAGAQAVSKETNGCPPYLRALRADLLVQGVLRDDGEKYTLTQDYTFTSPSAAAGVMVGASANGREVWKTGEGRVLSAVQNAGGGA